MPTADSPLTSYSPLTLYALPLLPQAQLASKAQGGDADQAELANARRALANAQAALANAQAALADAQASDPNKDAAAAAKRMQEVLAGQAIQFDGAPNNPLTPSPTSQPVARGSSCGSVGGRSCRVGRAASSHIPHSYFPFPLTTDP